MLFESAQAEIDAGCPHGGKTRFDYSSAIILGRVLASTFPGSPSAPETPSSIKALMDATATLVVLKSWKGRYHPGDYVRVAQPQLMGGCCIRYSLPVGSQFLIFARQESEPLEITEFSVIVLADASCEIAELDSLVRNLGQ
jgi:hypothetical protein